MESRPGTGAMFCTAKVRTTPLFRSLQTAAAGSRGLTAARPGGGGVGSLGHMTPSPTSTPTAPLSLPSSSTNTCVTPAPRQYVASSAASHWPPASSLISLSEISDGVAASITDPSHLLLPPPPNLLPPPPSGSVVAGGGGEMSGPPSVGVGLGIGGGTRVSQIPPPPPITTLHPLLASLQP